MFVSIALKISRLTKVLTVKWMLRHIGILWYSKIFFSYKSITNGIVNDTNKINLI